MIDFYVDDQGYFNFFNVEEINKTRELAKKVADMPEDSSTIEKWAETLANDIAKGND